MRPFSGGQDMNIDVMQQALQQAFQCQSTINGKDYVIQLLPTSVSLEVSQKLVKALGPAFGVLLDNNSDESMYQMEQTLFTDLFIAIAKQLDNLELTTLLQVLLKGAYCDGQAIDFDEHFRGKFGELLLVGEWALKENFKDFFISYLKAKGLEIHTLREMMMNHLQGTNTEELND